MRTALDSLRDRIQEDVGQRGLRRDPVRNLVNAFPDDFARACESLAHHPSPRLAIVTGFFIPTASPPAGETDGPLGALFLARALVPLGVRILLVTDDFCAAALEVGLAACRLRERVPVVVLPGASQAKALTDAELWSRLANAEADPIHDGEESAITHLLAIERVGPSHSHEQVPADHRDRCHTMRGRDITDFMSPAHRLFEFASKTAPRSMTTIGIGDGGNEIGMGKIPWEVIQRNIPDGGIVACRIPTDHLIVAGVSNWGGYALAAGVALLRQASLEPGLFDPNRELALLGAMVQAGPLVDGVTGKPTATVDGLTWERYSEVLTRIGEAFNASK